MSTYSFTIRKGLYQLELITTDKELLSEQFEKWVYQADEYARKQKAQEHKNALYETIKAEEEITKKNIEEQLSQHQVSDVQQTEEIPKQDTDSEPQETGEKDIDIFYKAPAKEVQEETPPQTQSTNVFDSILENSMKNPKAEMSFKPNPSIKKDNAFLNYIGDRKIERKIDYLLLTAYYFTQYEQKPRFTLKQLNAKLMQNLAIIIDHSVLQEAINRDYIECLPDLTGLVGTSEYRLTAYGEKTLFEE